MKQNVANCYYLNINFMRRGNDRSSQTSSNCTLGWCIFPNQSKPIKYLNDILVYKNISGYLKLNCINGEILSLFTLISYPEISASGNLSYKVYSIRSSLDLI
jgi:hypothetical protein